VLTKIDDILNSITMYSLVLYGLAWLVGVAGLLSILGVLHYSPIAMASSLTVLLTIGFVANMSLAKLYKVTPNFESGIITTFILFFVLAVPANTSEWIALVVAMFVAIASKYVITWRGAHIFNPAAIGAAIISILGIGFAAWWIATPIMLPFVSIIGILILRKTRRFGLFFSFILPCLVLLVFRGNSLQTLLLSFPLIFFATIMLTEPATIPNTNKWRLVYGVFVGTIAGLGLGLVSTPQVALLVGNLLAFVVSFRSSAALELVEKTKLAPNIYDFAFKSDKKISFRPGQYMEWTLGDIAFNFRGNRRTFTIASSPKNKEVHIGVRFYDSSSKFKQKLLSMEKGDVVHGGQVAGDFVLPKDENKKLVFVAGGIGITPFISMLSFLTDTNSKRDVSLYYFVNQKEDLVYTDIFNKAEKIGLKLIPMIGPDARLSNDILQKYTRDFLNSEFYLSGPPAMVRIYKKELKKLSVKKIHTDYFSGY